MVLIIKLRLEKNDINIAADLHFTIKITLNTFKAKHSDFTTNNNFQSVIVCYLGRQTFL